MKYADFIRTKQNHSAEQIYKYQSSYMAENAGQFPHRWINQ